MNRRILHVSFLFVALLIFGATSSLIAPVAQAQYISMTAAGQQANHNRASLSVGWTELQDTASAAITGGCTTGTTACSFNVVSTTAGSVGIILITTGNNTHISSASSTGGGGTWSLCPSSECAAFNASSGAVDAVYNLGLAENSQGVAATLSANATGYYTAEFIELLPPPGQTASFDTAAASATAACTTCTGIALTTSATDAVLQYVVNYGTATSSTPCSSPYITDQLNQCIGLN